VNNEEIARRSGAGVMAKGRGRKSERWFKELPDRRLRRGVVTSVADLIAAIELRVQLERRSEGIRLHTRQPRSSRRSGGAEALHQFKSQTDH
jgi:hypothetical protein